MSTLVKGKAIDEETRCVHYLSPEDVIAIKFKCCKEYYPCYYCHQETAGHPSAVCSKPEFETKAILCGVCKQEMTITEYKSSNYKCPFCKTAFNTKCSNHDHLYFEQ